MTAINPDLIRQYAAGATPSGLRNLLTLFEALTDQRNRAEAATVAHLHTIRKLSQALSNITEPTTGKRISDPAPSSKAKPPTPTPPPVEAVDLNLNLDLETEPSK